MSSGISEKELVTKFIEYMTTKQLEKFSEVVADDYIQHNPAIESGLSGIREAAQWFHSVFPDVTAEIQRVVKEDDIVVGYFLWSGTQKAEFMGLPASNIHATWTSIDIWRIENGKLAEHWDVVDWAGLMQQLQPK